MKTIFLALLHLHHHHHHWPIKTTLSEYIGQLDHRRRRIYILLSSFFFLPFSSIFRVTCPTNRQSATWNNHPRLLNLHPVRFCVRSLSSSILNVGFCVLVGRMITIFPYWIGRNYFATKVVSFSTMHWLLWILFAHLTLFGHLQSLVDFVELYNWEYFFLKVSISLFPNSWTDARWTWKVRSYLSFEFNYFLSELPLHRSYALILHMTLPSINFA